jgi:phosphopantothenoylcysteine decarboxylase/phosphopantothenate--cysteine ligase
MHGSMHHPVLEQSCRALAALGAQFVTPRDDYGKHNLPDERTLVDACAAAFRATRTPRPAARRD